MNERLSIRLTEWVKVYNIITSFIECPHWLSQWKQNLRDCINTTQHFFLSVFYGLIRALGHGIELIRAEILALTLISRMRQIKKMSSHWNTWKKGFASGKRRPSLTDRKHLSGIKKIVDKVVQESKKCISLKKICLE